MSNMWIKETACLSLWFERQFEICVKQLGCQTVFVSGNNCPEDITYSSPRHSTALIFQLISKAHNSLCALRFIIYTLSVSMVSRQAKRRDKWNLKHIWDWFLNKKQVWGEKPKSKTNWYNFNITGRKMKTCIADFERMSTLIIRILTKGGDRHGECSLSVEHIITQTGQHSFFYKDRSDILSCATKKKGAISEAKCMWGK